jgi:hypothetical protein
MSNIVKKYLPNIHFNKEEEEKNATTSLFWDMLMKKPSYKIHTFLPVPPKPILYEKAMFVFIKLYSPEFLISFFYNHFGIPAEISYYIMEIDFNQRKNEYLKCLTIEIKQRVSCTNANKDSYKRKLKYCKETETWRYSRKY